MAFPGKFFPRQGGGEVTIASAGLGKTTTSPSSNDTSLGSV
jgi:hypothetical protein